MITICTCSHSIEEHGIAGCGGACHICECHCFRGAKRIPKSCRYRLRQQTWRDDPQTVALVFGGIDADMRALMSNDQAKESA